MGIGVCTAGILKGVEYVEKMCYDLSDVWLSWDTALSGK